MPFEREFVKQLAQALRERRIANGVGLLDQAEADLASIDHQTPGCFSLLLLLAQWVDVGYRDHHILRSVLERFPPGWRKKLTVADYLRLRLVEAFESLSLGETDRTIEALEFVLSAERDLSETSLAALAHFWKGRAHRKKGEYEAALTHIVKARELAEASGDRMFIAVIKIQEGWLLFQKGMNKEALRLLDEAESVLKHTDHYVALGNIESARGRIVRRTGEYGKALDHFHRAICIYAKGDPNHRNLARALVNSAYVKRLLALDVRKRIDRAADSGRSLKKGDRHAIPVQGDDLRTRYQKLTQDAIVELGKARIIYEFNAHADGIGNVMLNLGALYLDRGDIESATAEATEAYRIGFELNDHILMARARTLQAAIENEHVEGQTGEAVDTAVHANNARAFSEEAHALAQGTQNRRLLAAAIMAQGMTAANDFFQEWEVARRCAAEATELIGAGENDHLVDDLANLKARIIRFSGINDTLRSWSTGIIGEKTFQQLEDEFAEIVIPKIWERNGRKISRVAQCLSMSPKKVRRILRNAGSLGRG